MSIDYFDPLAQTKRDSLISVQDFAVKRWLRDFLEILYKASREKSRSRHAPKPRYFLKAWCGKILHFDFQFQVSNSESLQTL